MAITVKKAVLWRKEVDNRPGALEPLAQAGADLQVVMAYRYPGSPIPPAAPTHDRQGGYGLAGHDCSANLRLFSHSVNPPWVFSHRFRFDLGTSGRRLIGYFSPEYFTAA